MSPEHPQGVPSPLGVPSTEPHPYHHTELRYNVSLEERTPGARAAFNSGARRLLQRRLELSLGRQSCLRFPFHVLVSHGGTPPWDTGAFFQLPQEHRGLTGISPPSPGHHRLSATPQLHSEVGHGRIHWASAG